MEVARTVEDVFSDFKGRRAGLIKALTDDVEEFMKQCDSAKGNLCLYGFPTENWEVNSPAVKVPPELPEPTLGINFARDGMPEKDWWSLVALHSDAWLFAVAVYLAGKFELDKNQRKSLLIMINELPTIFEVVNEQKTPGKKKSSVSNHSSTKSKPNSKGKSPRYRLPGSVGDVGSSGHEYDRNMKCPFYIGCKSMSLK
ncbi:hypothetical protein GIB67_013475 [Kingdonia uniflora]|uniref:PHD finger protein ALFIN-LIKE n=1 Tax=Kingdonia uniflora TaxID=39325 RepID=A0A7J7LRH9_9MAGN|nr:hypothetical protein GIB67_013475 [Kingdonia uniflora]